MKEISIDNFTLRKLQLEQKDILDEIVRICDKHDIVYYLAYGTLLGAVRHKGFIPWDDDLDVWMKREDYEKFIAIAEKEMSDGYYIRDASTVKKYGNLFAKIMKKDTVYIEENAPTGLRGGIFVDIFPLDHFGESALNNPSMTTKYFKLKRLLLAKCGYNVAKTARAKMIMAAVKMQSHFYTKKQLLLKIKKEERKLRNSGNELLFSISDSTTGKILTKKMKAKWFDETEKLEFEGSQYSCPQRYKEVLTSLYGDYMQLPPENQRYGHHGIVELKFHN